MSLMPLFVFLAIGLAVVGLGLGAWEYTVQQDYNKIANGPQDTTSRQRADDLARKGDNLALGANICFVGAAAGLIAAGIIGYPAWKAKKSRAGSESPEGTPAMSFMLSPNRNMDGINAGMFYRF